MSAEAVLGDVDLAQQLVVVDSQLLLPVLLIKNGVETIPLVFPSLERTCASSEFKTTNAVRLVVSLELSVGDQSQGGRDGFLDVLEVLLAEPNSSNFFVGDVVNMSDWSDGDRFLEMNTTAFDSLGSGLDSFLDILGGSEAFRLKELVLWEAGGDGHG